MSKLTAAPNASSAAPAPASPPAYGAAAMTDMESLIDFSKSEMLNMTKADALPNALKQGLRDQETLLAESDADEQLLMHITFSTKVKLHSISLAGPSDGRAPKDVKLFANKLSLGFDDVADMKADTELELAEKQVAGSGEKLELKFVKFQNVEKLTVFISSNQGDEESTALSCLKLWGASVATTNMSEFKRVVGEKGEGE